MGFEPVHVHHDRPYEWVGAWSERRAAIAPDAPALTDLSRGETWSYAELDDRANRTARMLASNGVGAGDRIAVLSRNRVEVLDLFLATAKLGAVLAPLSHRLAPPTIEQLVGLVDPDVLVAEGRFVELASRPDGLEVLCLEDGTEAPGASYAETLPADDAPVDATATALADVHLLLHTGGSTGTPKETAITHGSILWNSINTIAGWGLRDDDVTPMVFPFFHTGGWNVLTVPFFHMGGHLLIDRSVDPGAVLEAIDANGATVLVAVPTVLRAMAEHDRWTETDLSSLRFVKSGGGPCREAVIRAWRARGVDLSQGYGLTECGPNNFAMPTELAADHPDSIGRPAPHVSARVVDASDEVVPDGEIGELELAGPHAADRYWKNSDETAATFGDGWVSTGDLARMDDRGLFYIEGRKKHMFVSGGENVYPAEVEAAIAEHPDVDEVVVLGVPDERWGEVGLAVVESAERFDLEVLRSFLDDRLARYMHPRHLAFVDEMPTSGPSKIDREALRERFAP
ncbi:MAG: class I adenylate-forming enzyme family protein [Halobacteriales archaeon]